MDENLMKNVKDDERESFETAVNSIQKQAYVVAYSYLHSSHDSLDAVANAVEKTFRNINKLKSPEFFKTWFIRCTINECKMKLRSLKEIPFEDIAKQEFQQKNLEDKMDLEELMNGIDPELRMMIYMKYYLDYTFEEIAVCLDLSIGSVKSKIYRGLRKMKAELECKEALND
jgi:RNA polymerase sigma-70 factor, ECF subfamily